MANEASDQMGLPPYGKSNTALAIEFRDYMREFVGTQMAIMEAKLTATDVLASQMAIASNRAIEKAEQQINARLLTMNEFREQLQHQAATFATRAQVDGVRDALAKSGEERKAAILERVEVIERTISNWQGRLTVIGAVWALVVIFVSALLNFTIRTATEPRSITVSPPAVVVQPADPRRPP